MDIVAIGGYRRVVTRGFYESFFPGVVFGVVFRKEGYGTVLYLVLSLWERNSEMVLYGCMGFKKYRMGCFGCEGY